MLKKIILAGATASVIAASGLAAMTTTALADPYHPPYGPTWNQPYPPHNDCRPVVRTVKWYDRFGFPHWRRTVVTVSCDFNGPRPHPYWH